MKVSVFANVATLYQMLFKIRNDRFAASSNRTRHTINVRTRTTLRNIFVYEKHKMLFYF